MVETKFWSQTTWKKPSGTNLLWLLAGLLLLFDLIIEISASVSLKGSWLLPLLLAAVLSGGLGYIVIPILQQLKTGQFIREDGPQAHLKKAGTPTMGGIFFIPVGVFVALVATGWQSEVIAVSLVTLAYGAIGWLDDWQVLRLKSNKGISPPMKLLLQVAIAVLFCLWLFLTQPATITNIVLPFGLVLPLGLLFWFLAGFIMVAESNATNLTDGVDGLAAGTGAIAILGLAAVIAPSYPNLALFCVALSGACLGFVLHNRNPATVFMGDTGSLALGGALAAVGILTSNLWALFIVSGLFFVESLSVIAQVAYYKATKGPDGKGKRLFKMAPIHHHFELSGWAETQVVGAFYLVTAGLAITAMILT